MSFDPTIPQANTDLDALPIRNNFNALKTLIDALPASPPPSLKSGDGRVAPLAWVPLVDSRIVYQCGSG